jgi:ribonuclease P protein component
MAGPNAFPKKLRLKTSVEFKRVYENGSRRVSKTVVLFAHRNELEYSRFGITTPRKLGKAHERNRTRRRLKEILRTSRDLVPKGFDFVLNPRQASKLRDLQDLRTELHVLLGVAK